MDNQLLLNRIQTPDGTVLTSRHVHDYVTYADANGEEYMVDGGLDYLRRNVNYTPAKELSVYDDGTHETRRSTLQWGTYGFTGKDPLRYIAISDMNTDHIKAVLKNVPKIRSIYVETLKTELKYRLNSLENLQ